MLHHIADLPVHEVAHETGVPEGTVKARLSRGRTALAALLVRPHGGLTKDHPCLTSSEPRPTSTRDSRS